MPRMARVKLCGVDAWYHVCARVAARRGEYPLADPLVRRRLIEIIRRYAASYFCDVAGFCVMGNHYHVVVRFEAEREVGREELRRRAHLMYRSRRERMMVEGWSDEEWERYRRRLFDVSEFMRNVQAVFASWYNRTHERRGRLWAERFRSVVLGDERAVLDCLLYVELNPVRAGLVERPESWEGSSAWLRAAGLDGWLMPLEELLGAPSRERAMVEHRWMLYHRGAVPTRPGQAAIPREVLEREAARGFAVRGVFRRRLRYFVEGVALGSQAFVLELCAQLREAGRYPAGRYPVPTVGGAHMVLKNPREVAGLP